MVDEFLTYVEERLYTRIYNQYRDSIFRYVCARCNNEDIAIEITSNVFIKLFKNFHSINFETVRAWLYAVARNCLVDYWRSNKVNLVSADDEFWELNSSDSNENSVETEVKKELQKDMLKSVIKKCVPKDREVLSLRIYDELSFAEIAQILKLNEGEVKMRYYRAVKKITQIIDKKSIKLVFFLI
ncbi:MAG TPA: RNA polymerase sigma factor [Candidatus Dojkabacteria bacterium]|mgnify:CR=1 FL=1|nr:RNA polymerase sigma factor [Candidatus Dojkabacteria bacterium]HQF36053.1 RNA polymerase sigma factor [Candidatus Dojkabacteria bacterium]